MICQQIFFILALVIFLLKFLFKSASISFFPLVPRAGFGAAISHAVGRSSIVFGNSISRCCIVTAASRLLGAAAACVILYIYVFCSWTLQIVLEWLHQGCDSDLSAHVLHFGAGDFLLKFLLKSSTGKCFVQAL